MSFQFWKFSFWYIFLFSFYFWFDDKSTRSKNTFFLLLFSFTWTPLAYEFKNVSVNDFNVNQCIHFYIFILPLYTIFTIKFPFLLSNLIFIFFLKGIWHQQVFFPWDKTFTRDEEELLFFCLLDFSASYRMRYCHLIYTSLIFDIGCIMEFVKTVKFSTLKTAFNNLYINKYFTLFVFNYFLHFNFPLSPST